MRKTILKTLFVCLMCSVSLMANAQLRYNDQGLTLGQDKYTPLYFGDEWSIENYEGGLNVYRAWPFDGWGNYKLFIDSKTNVGIGKKPSYKLDVAGDVCTSGTYRTTSDSRLKNNIMRLDSKTCLDKILSLQGKYYNKKSIAIVDKEKELQNLLASGKIKEEDISKALELMNKQDTISDQKQYGFIAQELIKEFPDLVSEDSNGYLAIDYLGLIPVLVEALKEQQNIIQEQNKQYLQLIQK